MNVTGKLLFLILLCNTSLAQTLFTTNGNGLNWLTPANWDCGGCGLYPGQSATDDIVVVNHPIRLQGSVTLTVSSVTINNATFEIRGDAGNPNLTTGPVTINSSGTGTAEFSVLFGDPIITIDGDLIINRNTEASGGTALTRFRLGGSSTNITNATVNIFGNLEYNYLNANKSSAEGVSEISIGMSSTFNDKCTLTISRNIDLNYNYANVVDQNALAFEIGNSSLVSMSDLNLSMLEGGSASGADIRFAVLGNNGAKAIINGNATLLHNDPTPNQGSDNFLRAGADDNPNSIVEIRIMGFLILDSRYPTANNNNQVRISGNSKVSVNRDLIFNASAPTAQHRENRIILFNSGWLTLYGAIINTQQGVFDFEVSGGGTDNGTIEFSGVVAQNFPTQIATGQNYQNIVINNLSGTPMVIPTTQLRIEGNLQMLNGIVQSSLSNILILEDGATSNGGTSTSYVTGPIRKRGGITNNNVILPLGAGTRWAPLEFSNITGSTSYNLTAQYYNTPYATLATDGSFTMVSKKEYWDVSATGTIPTVDVTLHWKDACFSEITSVATSPSQDLYVGRFNTTAWNLLASSTIGGGSNTCNDAPYTGSITAKGVSIFNAMTFVSDQGVALPIKLRDFWAEAAVNNQVKLKWITEYEHATSHYLIQRLLNKNKTEFETIGRLPAAEYSTELISYEFIDLHPYEGKNYYRLIQVDADGKETHFNLIVYNHSEGVTPIQLIPNPVYSQDFLDILIANQSTHTITIFTNAGVDVTRLCTIENLTNQVRIYLNDLINGIYLIKVISDKGIKTERLLVHR